MRILLVSQMYPGRADPDLGVFVAQVERELLAQGHELERAVIDRRGGSRTKYAELGRDAVRKARRFSPDVVYAHFLVPAGALGALASLASGAALVLTAHGRDVRNIGAIPGVRGATRLAARRAAAVVAVSGYLRRELLLALPELAGKTEVIDCGVDLRRFRGRDAGEARALLGWEGEGPFFLFVGSLDERKNVSRLLEAFERLGSGQLALVGDGPLRARAEGRARVRLAGRVPHPRVAEWIAACDVLALPSTIEPFGQTLLEAMASERSVVATRIGGPPEFVPPGAGVLVDPLSVDSIEAGLREALELPRPNRTARLAAAEHDVVRQALRIADLLERVARRR
ncbi:MAG: glycosyltransferase [Thermoleophilia bacterium]|nr:glycosyltransferase [Thermoleophilia bacterium]